jgi:hypothetical protein
VSYSDPLKIAGGLTDAILKTIHEFDDSIPLATVLGVLEIVKIQLIEEHKEEENE